MRTVHRCPTCWLVQGLRRVGAASRLRSLTLDALRPVGTRRGRRGRPGLALAARGIRVVLRPCERHRGLGGALAPALGVPKHGTLTERSAVAPTRGINLVGHLRVDSGLGEASRLIAGAVRLSGLPHVLIDYDDGVHTHTDEALDGFARSNPHRLNLVHVNGDQLAAFTRAAGRSFFKRRRNVGYWHWEQPGLPEEWADGAEWFDEIWTPSRFSAQAIGAAVRAPVRRVPLPVRPWRGPLQGRERLGLPPGRFVFLFMFDYHSVFERKNPLAVVHAFQRAFADTDRALLVIKSSHADVDREAAERLARAVRHPGVRLLDACLTRPEIASLTAASDAYVSLHRSEGFGLGLAEAMLAGKAAIATDWSGNTDFMTPHNSFPVRCALATLDRDLGPYRKGQQWAEPDVDHAAELMRYVVDHPDDVAARAARGQRDLEEGFSTPSVANRIRELATA
jgi:glycosyltransferase involved in cell wall biosynthesis